MNSDSLGLFLRDTMNHIPPPIYTATIGSPCLFLRTLFTDCLTENFQLEVSVWKRYALSGDLMFSCFGKRIMCCFSLATGKLRVPTEGLHYPRITVFCTCLSVAWPLTFAFIFPGLYFFLGYLSWVFLSVSSYPLGIRCEYFKTSFWAIWCTAVEANQSWDFLNENSENHQGFRKLKIWNGWIGSSALHRECTGGSTELQATTFPGTFLHNVKGRELSTLGASASLWGWGTWGQSLQEHQDLLCFFSLLFSHVHTVRTVI